MTKDPVNMINTVNHKIWTRDQEGKKATAKRR